jgi:hypothetical protein
MQPARIRLHIDRLVLHGIDPREKAAFASALQAELSTALAEGVPAVSRYVTRLDLGAVKWEGRPANQPGPLGAAIGQALYRGLPR